MALVATTKTLAKLAVAGGAIYVTLTQDIWKTTYEGSKALVQVRKDVLPAADEYFNKKVPSVDEVNRTVVDTWNSGVQTAFTGVTSGVETIKNYGKTES